jgi:hypothetical protein
MNFETEGYTTGMLVTVTGCTTTTGNNRIYTLTAVSSGTLTVSEAMTTGSGVEGGAVTFTQAEPGIPILGFHNWSLSYTVDLHDSTNFDDSTGGRSYVTGITNWTATAEKYFLTSNNGLSTGNLWVGESCEMRLFLNYVSTPTTGNPSQYWNGDTIVTGLDHNTAVDALINQSLTFQGDKALTLRTQSQAWNLGPST